MTYLGRSASAHEIQALDKLAIETLGIPSLVLMENAGRAVSCEVLRQLKRPNRLNRPKKPFVTIFCGLGNNAGDGFVIARHLHEAGLEVHTYIIGKAGHLKSDAAVNYRILRKLGGKVRVVAAVDNVICRDMARSDIVVDAILGVGLNRKIREPFQGIIEAINHSKKYVIAVDVPSGLDATTGRIYGICVRAATTVTFTFAKKGFVKNKGPRFVGRVVVADIGIPKGLINIIRNS